MSNKRKVKGKGRKEGEKGYSVSVLVARELEGKEGRRKEGRRDRV